jgi:hypothetical protein
MERLSEELVESIDAYIESLFVPDDSILTESLSAAATAGLPAINVSPDQEAVVASTRFLPHTLELNPSSCLLSASAGQR